MKHTMTRRTMAESAALAGVAILAVVIPRTPARAARRRSERSRSALNGRCGLALARRRRTMRVGIRARGRLHQRVEFFG